MDEVEVGELQAQTIMLCRIYDLLAVIARNANRVEAEAVLELHESGGLVNDEIALRLE